MDINTLIDITMHFIISGNESPLLLVLPRISLKNCCDSDVVLFSIVLESFSDVYFYF